MSNYNNIPRTFDNPGSIHSGYHMNKVCICCSCFHGFPAGELASSHNTIKIPIKYLPSSLTGSTVYTPGFDCGEDIHFRSFRTSTVAML